LAEYVGVGEGSWVGLGLSKDSSMHATMGDDAVVACYSKTVANFWNTIHPPNSLAIEVRIQEK
jgi:hypothetical protein